MNATTTTTLDEQRQMHAVLSAINAREAGDAVRHAAGALAGRADNLLARINVEQPSLDDLGRAIASIEEVQSLCDNYLRSIRHHREGMVAAKAALASLDALAATLDQ